MHLSSVHRFRHHLALLTDAADPATAVDGGPRLLTGRHAGYLVERGHVEVCAVRRCPVVGVFTTYHPLTTIGPGAVLPDPSGLAAWQLALNPQPGAVVRSLCPATSRRLGFTGPGRSRDRMATSESAALAAALVRGVDAGLLALSDALRPPRPPGPAGTLEAAQIVSLAAGGVLTGNGRVGWLRVAGGHVRRNDGDDSAVFGGADPALLAGPDWVRAEGPCTVEAVSTAELLASGQLPAAVDHHMVLVLRTIDGRLSGHEPAVGAGADWSPTRCPHCAPPPVRRFRWGRVNSPRRPAGPSR